MEYTSIAGGPPLDRTDYLKWATVLILAEEDSEFWRVQAVHIMFSACWWHGW